MKNYFLILSAFAFFACNNAQEETKKEEIVEDIEINISKHGEDISEEGAITPVEFLSKLEGQDSINVKLAANITDVCQKKGCWMTLDLGDDKDMRVRFKDYEFFVPKDASGKTAIIQGVAKIDTTSIEELKHYLEDANAPQEEIDAVVEPEINYAFEATGVIIKEEKIVSNETKK